MKATDFCTSLVSADSSALDSTPYVAPDHVAEPRPDRLMRRAEVLRVTGLSKSALYRKIGDRTFPSAIALSIHSVAWLESEVSSWIAACVAASRAGGGE